MYVKFEKYINESKGDFIPKEKALDICRDLCDKLGINLIEDIYADTVGEPDCAYIGGSVRRGEPLVRDVDLLITKDINPFDLYKIEGIYIEKSGAKQIFLTYRNIPFNFWLCPDISQFGSFMIHITGPAGYNIGMRMLASKNGYKINQYGIFKDNKLILGSSETEGGFYKALKYNKYPYGKPWKDPKERGK